MTRRLSTVRLIAIVTLAVTGSCREVISPQRGFLAIPDQRLDVVTLDSARRVTLTYMCGNRFRLRNPLGDSIYVKWDVYSTSDSARMWLPGARANSYTETFFTTRLKGTTRVFWNGSLIQTKANGNSSCGYRLNSVVAEGVEGVSSGSVTFATPTTIHYAATASAGYTNLHVFVDSTEVAATGDIVVDRERALTIFADPIASNAQPDPNFTQRFTSLLTTTTPAAEYQSFILAFRALSRQVGDSVAEAVIDASFDAAIRWPRDSASYLRLSAALTGVLFYFDSIPLPYDATHPARNSTLPYGFPFVGTVLSRSPSRPLLSRAPRAPGGRLNATIGTPLPQNPRTVQIVHVNGVSTDLRGFGRNAANLDTAIRELPLLAGSGRVVQAGIWKESPSQGLLRSLADTATACALRLHPRVLRFLPRFMMPPCSDSARARFMRGQGSALIQAATQLESILSGSDPDLFPTTNTILQRAQVARDGIDHVVMVPHSQGNLFTIQAFQSLVSQGLAPSDSDAACFAAVPTASPTSFGYPAATWRVVPVQVNGDIILSSLVPGPKFPAVNTAQSIAIGISTAIPPGSTDFNLQSVVNIMKGIELHNFVGSYLNPIGARELVKQAVKDIYSQCEIELTLTGPQAPLDSGATYNLSLSISGADGRVISDNLPTRWTSSDSSIVSVSSQGVVTAVGPGEALITATHRGKSTDAVVDVVGSAGGPDFIVTVSNQVEDSYDPFSGDRTRVWRKQTIVAQIQSTDSLAYISAASLDAYDSNGIYYGIGSIPSIGTVFGNGVTTANGLFYDNPRSGGQKIRFGEAYWIIAELYARITVFKNGSMLTRFVRVSIPPT
jgi:hypothetical protein